jgi:hypothetical protein
MGISWKIKNQKVYLLAHGSMRSFGFLELQSRRLNYVLNENFLLRQIFPSLVSCQFSYLERK